MKIAVPCTADCVAGHFMKAEGYYYWNDVDNAQGEILLNPSIEGGCQQHQQIADELKQRGVSVVLVKNIGQRMLARLLDYSIQVWQLTGRKTIAELTQSSLDLNAIATPLVEASQGRPSLNHHSVKSTCCHNKQGSQPHACCHRSQAHGEQAHGHRPHSCGCHGNQ